MRAVSFLHDNYLDRVFTAAVEAVEESIVSALWHADTVTGYTGKVSKGFREAWNERNKIIKT